MAEETAVSAEPHELTREEVKEGLANLGRCADGRKFAYLDLHLTRRSLLGISAVSDFMHIQTLDCSFNRISDLSCLGSLASLTSLNASHNCLTRVLGFKPPLNLREADLSCNSISAINDLSGHRFLISLNLDDNQIRCISGVENLQCLRTLSLHRNQIQHINGIANLPLKELRLSGNRISVIECTETLSQLQRLELADNLVASLNGMEHLPMLRHLDMHRNAVGRLEDMECLQNLPLLHTLKLEENPVNRLECYRLRILFLIPGLMFLDDIEVVAEEKVAATNFHDPEHPQYQDVRRSDAQDLPPALFGVVAG